MDGKEERVRVVIDTNVLIGALVKDDSYKARILRNRQFLFFFRIMDWQRLKSSGPISVRSGE